MDATPASLHPAASFWALTTFPILVVALTSVIAFTSLGLFDPLVLPHLQRALGTCVCVGLGSLIVSGVLDGWRDRADRAIWASP